MRHLSQSSRRQFLRAGLSSVALRALGQEETMPNFSPTHGITKGPGFHWFGYYDKLQFSPDIQGLLV